MSWLPLVPLQERAAVIVDLLRHSRKRSRSLALCCAGVALGYADVGLVVAARTQRAGAADVEVPGLARQACVAL